MIYEKLRYRIFFCIGLPKCVNVIRIINGEVSKHEYHRLCIIQNQNIPMYNPDAPIKEQKIIQSVHFPWMANL